MVNILVVEDDKNLLKLMETVLKSHNYKVFSAKDGEEALEILDVQYIDLMISDIMMPKIDGYELTKSLRTSNYNLPILMVTAKEAFEDKKLGFLVGTDDYMIKPIDMDELLLRVKALLRRSKIVNENKIIIGDIELDYSNLLLKKKAEVVTMPKKEFYLLFKLLSYPGTIFTRQQLLDEIWGLDVDVDERTVDVHIKRLRDKTKDFKEFQINTVRGLGYKVEKYI